MSRWGPVVVAFAVGLWAASLGPAPVVEAAPSVSLSPPSGDAPSVDGTLSGSGWVCDGGAVPAGSASVVGPGVTGAATIGGRTGTLSGSFSVTGSPGDTVMITVTSEVSCPTIGPPIYLQASAAFTFHEQDTPTPRPTRTNTPVTPTATAPPMTSTPTPPPLPSPTAAPTQPPPTAPGRTVAPAASATPSGPTATPQPSPTGAPTPAQAPTAETLLVVGCVPASPPTLLFTPLYLLDAQEPGGQPEGPEFMVDLRPSADDPHAFTFLPPPAEPERVFAVRIEGDDPACPLDDGPEYWIAGQNLVAATVPPGITSLDVCTIGDKVPCEYPVVKGLVIERGSPSVELTGSDPPGTDGAWDVEKSYFLEDLKNVKQRFRWETNLEASVGRLQASLLPFSTTAENDPFAPQGLVATWDVDCVDCEFIVDLSALAPPDPPKKKKWYEKVFDVILAPFKFVFGVVGNVLSALAKAVGIGGDGDSTEQAEIVNQKLEAASPGDYLVAGENSVFLQPTTFYFRILPLDHEALTGATSNSVRLQQVDKPPDIKIEASPTPGTLNLPYEVHFLTYHGILPPQVPNNICYIVTQDAWPKGVPPFQYTTKQSESFVSGAAWYKKGQTICKPVPKEPSIIEQIISWAEATVNWASQAWTDLKEFAVDVVLKYTPLGLQCSAAEAAGAIPKGACNKAFTIALDAALVALGIPPDLPNFDQLMDQGIEYLAAQAASQMAIPPEVIEAAVAQGGPYAGVALDLAEAELRKELQAQIESELADVATAIQLGYAASVAWVPDGVPVRPDDYQPPGAVVRVTRKSGVPGGETGCSVKIRDNLTLTAQNVDSPPPAWANFVNNLPHKLSHLTLYDFLANEADMPGFPGGANKNLTVPQLAPGESYVIPMTFKPNYYKSGWQPLGAISTSNYIGVWQYLHEVGTLHLEAYGTCGSDTLDVPAKAQLLGAQIGAPE